MQTVYRDLTELVTARGTGLYRTRDGRYAFACGVHRVQRLPVVADPVDLLGMTCRVCEAEIEAGLERRAFRQAVAEGN